MIDEQKKKALAAALKKVEKDFGKNAVMCMGDCPDATIEVIPTGSVNLDIALGVGGLPAVVLLSCTVPKPQVSPLWQCLLSQKLRSWVAWRCMSTLSMLWT